MDKIPRTKRQVARFLEHVALRANAFHGKALRGRITRSTSPMAAVVGTNEEYMIAMDAAAIVAASPVAELDLPVAANA